jgi:hypothetical protein
MIFGALDGGGAPRTLSGRSPDSSGRSVGGAVEPLKPGVQSSRHLGAAIADREDLNAPWVRPPSPGILPRQTNDLAVMVEDDTSDCITGLEDQRDRDHGVIAGLAGVRDSHALEGASGVGQK